MADELKWEFSVDPLRGLPDLRERLRGLGVPDEDLCWVVGDDVLQGLHRAWGLDIVRAAVPSPMLAFRSVGQWRPPGPLPPSPWPEREDLPDE